jgi:hypothetical protein
MINAQPWQKPRIFLKVTLGALKRLLRHWYHYRCQTSSHVVLACEQAFFASSLLSCFHVLKAQFTLHRPQTSFLASNVASNS